MEVVDGAPKREVVVVVGMVMRGAAAGSAGAMRSISTR